LRVPLLLALFLFGCQPEAPVNPAAVLGTGEWDWEALQIEDAVPVIQGPQGGFHLLLSVRVAGLESGNPSDVDDRKNPTTTFQVEYMGTNLSPNAQYIQGLELAPDSALPFSHEMVGRFAILSIESDEELDGAKVDVSVSVEDIHGITVTDSRSITTYPHPLNN
jgi:hypothetical protein